MSAIQCRSLCLLLAALFFLGSRGAAQSTAADQSFKAIPQQIKSNAEVRATNKANQVANTATDKLDSGMGKAYRGLVNMFKKKNKPVKDTVKMPGTLVKDSVGGAAQPKAGAFAPARLRGHAVAEAPAFSGASKHCGIVPAWARKAQRGLVTT